MAGGGGDAAADGLDDEAGDVGGEKDARVPDGGQAGKGRVQGEGNVLEREVDADADKGRAQDDGADLQLKGAFVPRVRGEQDAADVACDGKCMLVMEMAWLGSWVSLTHPQFLIPDRR